MLKDYNVLITLINLAFDLLDFAEKSMYICIYNPSNVADVAFNKHTTSGYLCIVGGFLQNNFVQSRNLQLFKFSLQTFEQ